MAAKRRAYRLIDEETVRLSLNIRRSHYDAMEQSRKRGQNEYIEERLNLDPKHLKLVTRNQKEQEAYAKNRPTTNEARIAEETRNI